MNRRHRNVTKKTQGPSSYGNDVGFRLHPLMLACTGVLAYGAFATPVFAASCTVGGNSYTNCIQGVAGSAGSDASGAAGSRGDDGGTVANPGSAGTAGGSGGAAANVATAGLAGNAVAAGGLVTVVVGDSLVGGSGGSGGNANGGQGGDGGWAVQWSNANGGNAGSGGLAGTAKNGGSGGSAVNGSVFTVTNRGSLVGGTGGSGGNAAGGAGGRGGQGANNTGRAGNGGDGNSGGAAGNGGNGGVAVAGSNFLLVNSGTIRGGRGGMSGAAPGGAGGTPGLAGAPGGANGTAGTAGSDGTTGTYGAGAAGVTSTGGSIVTTSGAIDGGLSGNGAVRANAIEFSGGNNTLTLQNGYSFTGNVISAGGDTLALGGAGNGSFNVASLAATPPSSWTGAVQYSGFSQYAKTGSGTWTLTGTTAEVTPWTIGDGTLSVSDDASLGAASGSLTFAGGTLQNTGFMSMRREITLETSGTLQTDAEVYAIGAISGAGSLTKTGASTLNISSFNTYSGATTVASGTLALIGDGRIANSSLVTVDSGAAFDISGLISGTMINNLAGGGNVELGSNTLGIGNASGTFAGTINGAGNLVKEGDGTFTLTGNNGYTGLTIVSAGTLQIGNGGTTGAMAGSIRNNSQLVFNRSNAQTYGGVISGSGSLTKTGAGNLTLLSDNNYTGGTTISSGTLTLGNGGTTGSVAGDISNNGELVLNHSNARTLSNKVSGSGTLTKTGSNTLTLIGDNTYSGVTTISAGRLEIGNGGTTGSVAGNIINNATLAFNRSDDITYAGAISGTGSVIQAGNGVLTLSGNNSYSGGTVVTAGKLILRGVNAAGTGAIVNDDDVVFQGTTGEFSNAVNGAGNITLSNNSAIDASGAANVSAVSIDGTSTLTLQDATVWTAGNGFSNAGTLALNNTAQLVGDLDNSGVVIMSNQQYVTSAIVGDLTNRGRMVLNPTATSAGNTLTINGDYVGVAGSSVSLGAVLAGDNSLTDRLTILGNASGSSTLYVVNENGPGAQTVQGLKLISVQGTSDAVFTQGNRIAAGLYDYSLVKKGNDWYLDSFNNSVRQVRPEAASYAANLQAANSLFTLSMHDRAGETRYKDPATGETRTTSMWMRNEGARGKSSMSDGQNKTSTNSYVLQLGGDVLQLSSGSMGKFNLGVMGGYANAKGQTHNSLEGYSARNSLSGYSAGLYGTWYANAKEKGGLYADSWLQYSWFNNQVDGQDIAQEKYVSRGLTASLETGYDWQLSRWTTAGGINNSLWLQPHAQAIWMGVKADDHRESNGSLVQGLGNDNLQTKVGLRAYLNGKSALDRHTDRLFQPYVEANWVHNTDQYGVRIDGVDDHIKGARNAAELKTGVEAKLSESLSIHGGIAGQVGTSSYTDISASLGGKLRF